MGSVVGNQESKKRGPPISSLGLDLPLRSPQTLIWPIGLSIDVQGQRGDRTSQPKRDYLMTYTKNGQKCGFRAELKSSKTDHFGYQNRLSRPGNEPAWLETPWVLFLAPTDQICRLRYWCPIGPSCSPRSPCIRPRWFSAMLDPIPPSKVIYDSDND